jgi:hypothetical protein
VDRFSYPIFMPYRLLLLGFLCFIVAEISIWKGKALTRGHGLVSRAEDPKSFWWIVAMWYVGGVVLIGDFFYKIWN